MCAARSPLPRRAPHHDNVHDEADQEIREVELQLFPEIVATLAHLGNRRTAFDTKYVRGVCAGDAVAFTHNCPHICHVRVQSEWPY